MNRLLRRVHASSQLPSQNIKGAGNTLGALVLYDLAFPAYRSPLTAYCFSPAHRLLLLSRDQLGQSTLLPGRGVLMNDALAAGPVQQLDRLVVRGLGLSASGTSDLLERGAELAPLRPVSNGPGAALAHTLGGGSDSGHGNLGKQSSRSGDVPEAEPENIGRTPCKVKRQAALTLPLPHV